MKKIQYIILLSMFIGFTSCEKDKNKEEGRLTEAGKIIYDEVTSTIEHYIWILNFAQKIDLYLQSDDIKRRNVETWLFKNYTILETENELIITKKGYGDWKRENNWLGEVTSDNYWKITRSSEESLNTPSSQWNIETYYDKDQTFQISTQTENTWNVLINNCYREDKAGPKSNAHLQIQMQSNHAFTRFDILNKYSVKMADNTLGSIEYDISTKYNITEPILFEDNRRHKFTEGEIAMEVTRSKNNADQAEPDNIITGILPNGDVSITFRGITEIWD